MSESSLRPKDWDEYVGQDKLKKRLRVAINGALKREAPLDHTLFQAPPGYGKTSLAALIAQEMVEDLHVLVMPVKPKVLQDTLLRKPGIIFLDEMHRLPPKDQEILLYPMEEDRELHFPNGNVLKIPHPFTVIGATTELKKIIEPLRDRFIHKPRFDLYTDEEMAVIVKQMARNVGIRDLSDAHALALGKASAGVPRQARTLIFMARDLGTTDPKRVCHMAGITADGLTEDHVDYLVALDSLGQIAGVDVLANYTGQPKEVIVNIEKLLLRKDMISYTQKGRVLTTKGYKVTQELAS